MIAIYKRKGQCCDPGNYRPVSREVVQENNQRLRG